MASVTSLHVGELPVLSCDSASTDLSAAVAAPGRPELFVVLKEGIVDCQFLPGLDPATRDQCEGVFEPEVAVAGVVEEVTLDCAPFFDAVEAVVPLSDNFALGAGAPGCRRVGRVGHNLRSLDPFAPDFNDFAGLDGLGREAAAAVDGRRPQFNLRAEP